MTDIICIDPGHGGYDPGAVYGGVREKDITLHIGLQLRDILRRAGFGVVMTRESDASPGGATNVNADLNERCRIANAARADVFLSIHVNAGGGHGAEIYVNGDGGPIAALAKGIIGDVSLVCGVHGQAVRDGGKNGAGWRVIAGTNMDAMLLEVGFIDTDDLRKIQARIDDFAPMIARQFCAFYGVPFPTATPAHAPTCDKQAAEDVIALYGQLAKRATPAMVVAANFAANAVRRAAGIPITTDLGKPTVEAADRMEAFTQAVWWTASPDSQECHHIAADALRAL
ncbi:N-acetylmuramoyl-L-alanine amidase family protein [Tumebacillus permanentifrigoris]|uniref:N-acetylmuramoyl-L-alanine amidase n=1 Tax=Tumebacillus permanentifrigoris TaxID=378543 RepID=A0A316D4I7_9BACL|nr:N-acetylmuramoyl-L-alanine amidase [Tumebacillus permanentifrigoris]PWK07490.1 N-acetylmuramoyl-L-alanine amidase [Tumebacillus permanentifrigoris]